MKKSKENRLVQLDESIPRFEVKKSVVKKAKYYSVSTLFTVIFLAAAILLNILFGILSNKVNLRLDLTAESIFTISETSKSLISELSETDKKVELIIAADEEKARERASSSGSSAVSVFKYIIETCESYSKEYGGISVSFVDPTYNPYYYSSRGINLADGTDPNVSGAVIMVVYSPDTGRYKLIKSTAVQNLQYIGFERRLSSAVLFVSKDNLQTVGFITGHGEDSAPYYQQLLEDNGYVLEYIKLSDVEKIPDSISMIAIVNPTRTYDTADIEKIDAFLTNGELLGKHLMVFGDLDMAENPLLETYLKDEWGISFGKKCVFDGNNDYIYEIQGSGITFLTVDYSETSVAGSLASSDSPLRVLLGKTKSVKREFDSLDNIKTYSLLSSSETSYSKNIVNYQNGKTYAKEEGDSEGPFDIGVISVKSRYDGTVKTTSNVAVFGTTALMDSVFLTNYYGATQATSEYMLNFTKSLVASTEGIDTDIISVNLAGDKLRFSSNTEYILSFTSIIIIVPLIFAGIGVFRLIKRKYR